MRGGKDRARVAGERWHPRSRCGSGTSSGAREGKTEESVAGSITDLRTALVDDNKPCAEARDRKCGAGGAGGEFKLARFGIARRRCNWLQVRPLSKPPSLIQRRAQRAARSRPCLFVRASDALHKRASAYKALIRMGSVVLTCIVGEPSMREHPFPPAVDNSTYVIRWSTSCRGGVSGGTGEVSVADTNLNDGGSISVDGYFRWLIVNGRVLGAAVSALRAGADEPFGAPELSPVVRSVGGCLPLVGLWVLGWGRLRAFSSSEAAEIGVAHRRTVRVAVPHVPPRRAVHRSAV
jgi:hypothetical protein